MPVAGFFDLPLELRQMIYEHLLPERRMQENALPPYVAPEGTVMASACRADHRLRSELQAWAARYCAMQIMVSATAPLPTLDEIYHTPQIELIIDCYGPDASESYMVRLRENIKFLVTTMMNCPKLKRLSIAFSRAKTAGKDEQAYRVTGYWETLSLKDSCTNGAQLNNKRREYVLKTRASAHVPFVDYVVAPVDHLCMYEFAYTQPVEGLKSSTAWPFDWDYMSDLFIALENWLMGCRDASFGDRRNQSKACSMSVGQKKRAGHSRIIGVKVVDIKSRRERQLPRDRRDLG